MARYTELSSPAPVLPHIEGLPCSVCDAPFEKGQQVRDLFVYKLGELDWIEHQHDLCPS
jgi:hypothetical protein